MKKKSPTARLYYNKENFYNVAYTNAKQDVTLSLTEAYFKSQGRGKPWSCGISNAILDQKDRFPHVVLYAQTIGSATYIVTKTNSGGQPSHAVRYSHKGGSLQEAYDKSNRDTLAALIKKNPVLHLKKYRADPRTERHVSSGTPEHDKKEDKNKRGLVGNARRMANAGFIPNEFVHQVEA